MITDVDQLPDIAGKEAIGVAQADCVLLVTPARLGSHFEAGIAFARGIPIVMLIEDQATHTWVSFHLRPELIKCYTEDEAIATVLGVLDGTVSTSRHLMGQYNAVVA
jgi:nucleoside 2-deoxyribosyltransferase